MRLAEDRACAGKPLVQTQVLGPRYIPISPVLSKCFWTPSDFRRATVVDSVAVRSSRFNTVQQAVGNPNNYPLDTCWRVVAECFE
jgi:hypothetical protein